MAHFLAACFLLLFLFLGCLGLFALAVTKVVAPDGRGHARGLGGGCAAMLALLLLSGLGIAGLAATVAAIGIGTVSEWNPIRYIEITRSHGSHGTVEHEAQAGPPRRADAADWHGLDEIPEALPNEGESDALSARFSVRSEAGDAMVELLVELLVELQHELLGLDRAELGERLTILEQRAPEGQGFRVYELRLPVSEEELERFEHQLRAELDGLRLPERVRIDFEGTR